MTRSWKIFLGSWEVLVKLEFILGKTVGTLVFIIRMICCQLAGVKRRLIIYCVSFMCLCVIVYCRQVVEEINLRIFAKFVADARGIDQVFCRKILKMAENQWPEICSFHMDQLMDTSVHHISKNTGQNTQKTAYKYTHIRQKSQKKIKNGITNSRY